MSRYQTGTSEATLPAHLKITKRGRENEKKIARKNVGAEMISFATQMQTHTHARGKDRK